jgi:hypothetical protein
MWRIYSNPDPHKSPLTTHKGMWRTYFNLDPHGYGSLDMNLKLVVTAFVGTLTTLVATAVHLSTNHGSNVVVLHLLLVTYRYE